MMLALGLVAYWPYDDPTGTAARELVAGMDGLYVGTFALGAEGIGDGSASTQLNSAGEVDGKVTIYTAALSGLWTSASLDDEATCGIWAKVRNVGVWTDGQSRNWSNFYRDGANRRYLQKLNPSKLRAFNRSGDVFDIMDEAGQADTGWVHWMYSWSVADNKFKSFKNGVTVDEVSRMTAWSGAAGLNISQTHMGGAWDGYIAKGFIKAGPISDADALIVGTLPS